VYRCRNEAGLELDWTVVVERFSQTIYRIDVIKPHAVCSLSKLLLRLPTPGPLSATAPGAYHHTGRINQAVSFVKDPLSLALIEPSAEGLAIFGIDRPVPCAAEAPLELVTAWKLGKDVTGIDQTHLTGIWAH
jgi:hypothetical protein